MYRQLSQTRLGVQCVVVACMIMAPLSALAQSLDFIVDRADGAVYIKNSSDTAIAFDGYQFESFGAALDISNWTPIAENYDQDNDQSVDSLSTWLIGTANSSIVEEASLQEQSASIVPGQIVSLGLFFDTGLPEGGLVNVFNGTTSEFVFPDFRTLTADYDGDLDVDLDDYGIFSDTFGSTVDLRADGNNDSVINAADYTIWRDSNELIMSQATPIAAAAFAIPEPATLAMAALIVASLPATRRHRSAVHGLGSAVA